MKIYDNDDTLIEQPDLEKGYLMPDKIFVRHHAAVEAVEEIWHWEAVAEYPGGGKEVEKAVDVPGIPAMEAWDEYEDIQRYIKYTTEELAVNARVKRKALLEACDWVNLLDAPIDTATREAYRAYRQALRDLPEQPDFPDVIDWPALPAIVKAAPDPVDVAFDTLVGGAANA